MIPKVGQSSLNFKRAYVSHDPQTESVLDEKRRYSMFGESVPFPKKDFETCTKEVNISSNNCGYDVFFYLRNKEDVEDEFVAKADIYDRDHNQRMRLLKTIEMDSGEYRNMENTPVNKMAFDIFSKMYRSCVDFMEDLSGIYDKD